MARSQAGVKRENAGDVLLVSVSGVIDETFEGFGDLTAFKAAVVDVSQITRMSSFGVRQWLRAMEAVPRSIEDLYLLGCPTFFVDQLNMVLHFCGPAKILTVVAPYACPGCGMESGQWIDVLSERAALSTGDVPIRMCQRCGDELELDEMAASYFAFLDKYAASKIQPAVAQLLAARALYFSPESATEHPPRIIKLVHREVTYFRIIGTIGSMFRARPLLVGAEGEVVIDLAEVERSDAAGKLEWQRLLKTMSRQVSGITLVDAPEAVLSLAAEALALAPNIAVASVLVRYVCVECARISLISESISLAALRDLVCSTCGGITRTELKFAALAPLRAATFRPPASSAHLIERRGELLSRAVTDANVANAGAHATAHISADDTILGKYKIVRRLSAGGMAEVFLANQVGIGGFEKPVAVKRIQRAMLESRHHAIELFLNEAKIAGRLTHPNIVQVLDVGEVGGALYLAMEYVHGRDLRKVIRRLQVTNSKMPLGVACFIVREVALALDYAYWSNDMSGRQLAVIHRDVTPHNIVLGYDGAVKLVDFGVAMSAVTEHAEPMIVGKWSYMSPEMTMNQRVDHRSDLFSLGVILYLLVSGAKPFGGTEPQEIVALIRGGRYPRLLDIAPEVPGRLAALVDRMLASNPDDRPERGQLVVAELTEIARLHGLESSATSVQAFVRQLLPEHSGVRHSGAYELVRMAPEDSGSTTAHDKTRRPDERLSSSTSIQAMPADVSQSLRARFRPTPSAGISRIPARTSGASASDAMIRTRRSMRAETSRARRGPRASVLAAALAIAIGTLALIVYRMWRG